MSDNGSLVVIGAGGHAKVVIATARAAGWAIAGIVDDDPGLRGSDVLGVEVIGPVGLVEELDADGAVIAIGSNRIRQAISEAIHTRWIRLVHPTADVHETVEIGDGTVVFAGAVIQPDTKIGEHVIVNTSATIDHDCHVGDYAHIAPGANLAGDVVIGEGAFLGIGSSAVPGASVGEWATVGAGGVVIADVEDGVTAVGIPAIRLGQGR